MSLIEITDFHAENLYEYSFDQMVGTFKPLRSEEEKKYIAARKQPIILKMLPIALKNEYPSLSASSIQLYSVRLGLAKLSHDERVSKIIDLCANAFSSANESNLNLCFQSIQKADYNYATTITTGKFKMAVTEEVKSFISEKSDYLGLNESSLGIIMFFLGIESATMPQIYKSKVQLEINSFWNSLNRRLKILETYAFIDL